MNVDMGLVVELLTMVFIVAIFYWATKKVGWNDGSWGDFGVLAVFVVLISLVLWGWRVEQAKKPIKSRPTSVEREFKKSPDKSKKLDEDAKKLQEDGQKDLDDFRRKVLSE